MSDVKKSEEHIGRPSMLILQCETVAVKFEKGTKFPLRLETNKVGDCVCLAMISQSQGLACLSHLHMACLDQSNWETLKESLEVLITKQGLNAENTFVALIGGHESTMPKCYDYDEDKYVGILALKEYLETKFGSVVAELGGEPSIERCVELTSEAVRVVRIAFSSDKRELAFNQFIHAQDEGASYGKVTNVFYQQHGIYPSTKGSTPELDDFFVTLDFINATLDDNRKFPELEEVLYKTICDRYRRMGLWATQLYLSTEKYAREICVGKLVRRFDLEQLDEGETRKVSAAAFYCTVSKPAWFRFFRKHVESSALYGFGYDRFNLFRDPRVRKAVAEGALHIDNDFEERLPAFLEDTRKAEGSDKPPRRPNSPSRAPGRELSCVSQ